MSPESERLYAAVRAGIEASMQVRARYEARFIDRQTAIRQLSEIGLLTQTVKATDFLDRVTTVTVRPPWWKFWVKPTTTIVPDKED